MKNKLFQITLLSLFLLLSGGPQAGHYRYYLVQNEDFPELPPFLGPAGEWVDSVMERLSLEERIAQMIMVYAYSNLGEEHEAAVIRQISRYKIGGILFFQGAPVQQARMTNRFQEVSEVPLLIAIDGETGLGMRLEGTMTYPMAMTLGAVTDLQLIYRIGAQMADQFRRLGVHMNFAPVADINNNPANPVIGSRSFGEEPGNVADKVVAMMRGMQDHGLLVVAKHFPGHGDTDTDSHRVLPVIPHDRSRLDSVELLPFREAISKGLSAIMVAHLQVPAIDPREARATTLSAPAINGLLKGEMGFRGLVISDALNMKALGDSYSGTSLEVEAVAAGNDIILMPSDVRSTISMIRQAVRNGEIPEEQINASCRKILRAKYWAGLDQREPVRTEGLMADLNKPAYSALYRELVRHSLCLVKNDGPVIPVRDLPSVDLATVTIGGEGDAGWGQSTDLYMDGTHYILSDPEDAAMRDGMIRKLAAHNTIIINVLNTSTRASRKYGISDGTLRFIEQLDSASTLILNVAGLPYALTRFTNLDRLDAVILSFDDDPLYQDNVAQAIFGGIPFSGALPVSGGKVAPAGTGVRTERPIRLGYGLPEDAGLNGDSLKKMEEIIAEAIRQKAMPGCQVLVARRGKVVWHRAYGYHTYQRKRAVQLTDLYDLASVTKITATLPALMRLRDQGKFHEDSLMGAYDPVPAESNKAGLLVSDVLTHQSGLQAWIPFYYRTMEPLEPTQRLISTRWSPVYPLKIAEATYANRNVKYVDSVYQNRYSPAYPVQVAEDLFMRKEYIDSLFSWIYHSELRPKEYIYSGLGFHMFQWMIESITDTLLYPYVWQNFYAPMGAGTLGYKPLERFQQERITPTENDLFFRKQLLQGHVHDMGTAMLGGVSGTAGLFSDANDLAKMMQLYLNGGWYGEKKYIDSATLAIYTSCYNCDEGNRRGLGFDKPVTDGSEESPACLSASPSSFGHSGFTGSLAWVDPEYDLVYIFLSNRIHPNQGNDKLIETNVRTRVQQVVYDALLDEP